MSDDAITSFDDAASIGFKIIEMAERVLTLHQVVPGSTAAWGFEMDDQRFEVTLKVEPNG